METGAHRGRVLGRGRWPGSSSVSRKPEDPGGSRILEPGAGSVLAALGVRAPRPTNRRLLGEAGSRAGQSAPGSIGPIWLGARQLHRLLAAGQPRHGRMGRLLVGSAAPASIDRGTRGRTTSGSMGRLGATGDTSADAGTAGHRRAVSPARRSLERKRVRRAAGRAGASGPGRL